MKTLKRQSFFPNFIIVLALLLSMLQSTQATAFARPASAEVTTSVTIAGDLQTEMGCVGDWDPACATTHLTYDAVDDVWQGSWLIPAGNYNYKAAINDSFGVSYGLHTGSDNIPLSLSVDTTVKFYYSDITHWVTTNVEAPIATIPGSFQSELGCSGDWQTDCLRSWLQDTNGDGIYSLVTTSIPPGSYEGKVATNESWDVNYGKGGALNGDNYAFDVVVADSTVTFTYTSSTHILDIKVKSPGPQLDNNVEWDGLRHDSRDLLYRTPGGAVSSGTPVTLRFRTFHTDVDKVKVRLYDPNTSTQRIEIMTLAASDVSCYEVGLEKSSCDYWAYTLPNASPSNLWYRFIISDGTNIAYYADNTAALDGGLGSPSANVVDNSFALMVYDPSFTAPSWAKDAVIYQIFPDRFRGGRTNNNPKTGDSRYDVPVLKLPWGTLPEGYCKNYKDATSITCPWRFNSALNPAKETPLGRDYMGGDLKGVDQKLDYLKSLGVNTIYFNPIFNSGSNHGYDTQDYYKIDPYFGTEQDWKILVVHANQKGVRIVLDGVFNHMSSDSAFFDRYHHFYTVGACESLASPYRSWFTFHDVALGTGTCAGSAGANSATYDGWFGFDSIPVLTKSNPQVQDYFILGQNSVTKTWLNKGASGWRLDVMGDSSFPSGYWNSFRQTVKQTDPNALIIGELWQKDSTLLRFLRGDRADTTMNYRLRDAVIGLLTPNSNFDSKGFADSGRPITPAEFASRLGSIQEDYPGAAFYSLMNLVDSHDTERILWTLTPGSATTAAKENNAANLADGKNRQRLASLIQFTLPGAPTIYYGDEVGMTGADDPDDRRTYPWADQGGKPDTNLFKHYQTLAALRKQNAALTSGDLRVLLADNSTDTVVYGRKTASQAALVAINSGLKSRIVKIPLSGYLPNGVVFKSIYGVGNTGAIFTTVTGGFVTITLKPQSAWLLVSGATDLQPPAVPTDLVVTDEGTAQISLSWTASSNTAGYNVYHSPVSGGGWAKVNNSLQTGTTFVDTGLRNGQNYFYVVSALDAAGNESAFSNIVVGKPHLVIGWANLQWPPTLTHTISVTTRTDNVYGKVWIDGVTNLPGATPGLAAQLGFGPVGSNPAGNSAWIWESATFNGNNGNNDEFVASLLPESAGVFDYIYRYSTTGGRDWLYADQNGPISASSLPSNPGKLTVSPSGDSLAPDVPANLHVTVASPVEIGLAWDANAVDASLYGYEVLRSDASGGPYSLIARLTGTTYVDSNVTEGSSYYYVVRALDNAFNRSANSTEVTATATPRTVTLNLTVTVPASTDGTGKSVYIAGSLDRLDGGLPAWNPGGVVLTRVDATHWSISLTGKESTQIEYKYALESWDFVEKDVACGELGNRAITLTYGATGTMTVDDTVLNWRNVPLCGN